MNTTFTHAEAGFTPIEIKIRLETPNDLEKFLLAASISGNDLADRSPFYKDIGNRDNFYHGEVKHAIDSLVSDQVWTQLNAKLRKHQLNSKT